MRAVVLDAHGGPEQLHLRQVPRPTPGPLQVLVQVRAVALNRLDIWVREGLPGARLEYPHRLGSDASGIVVELGAGVSENELGREVVLNPGWGCGRCESCLAGCDNLCARYKILGENTQGAYGEYVCVPLANLVDKPPRLSFVEASAFPLTFLTAWQMLTVRAKVGPTSRVLIHAAGSGVGSAAIQIAKLHGAYVVALASSEHKLAKASALGADACVLSPRSPPVQKGKPAWEGEVRALPEVGKRGVDIVFEHVGADTWPSSIRLCTKGGCVVTCGASSGWDARTDLRQVFFRQIQILGSTMASRAQLPKIARLVQAEKLEPVIDRVFPFAEAADAHRYLDRREQFGKVVLDMAPAAPSA